MSKLLFHTILDAKQAKTFPPSKMLASTKKVFPPKKDQLRISAILKKRKTLGDMKEGARGKWKTWTKIGLFLATTWNPL